MAVTVDSGLTEVCGLRVAGRLAPVGRTAQGVADLVMEAGPLTGDAGELDRIEQSDRTFAVCQIGQVVFARFHGVARAALDMSAGTATIDVSADAPPGMDEVIAGGPVLALAVSLRGRPLLHASAVSMGGHAVAFAGRSGAGKSTLAALACLAGAEMVADDTLALAVHASEVRCLPGSRELRLRPASAELLAAAPWHRRATADARVAVLAGSKTLAPSTLAAIVVPAVTLDGVPGVQRLEGVAASTALLGCSRLVALQTPDHPKSMFELAVTLAERIPVTASPCLA